jgi:hypothetical protein
MTFKEPQAKTTDFGLIILAGDLGGTASAPSVLKINGSSVPAGGSLTTGNVLQVTGAATLGYAAVNLAGGAGYITGQLPIGNLANGTVGQFLLTNSGATASVWTSISGDISASVSTVGQLTITQISGTSPVNITTASTFQWSSGVSSPILTQATGSSAGQALTIQAQNAAGTNQAGGNLVLKSGAATGSGFDGYVLLETGTSNTVQAFVSAPLTGTMSTGGLGIGSTPGVSPTITSGTGAPTSTQPQGSIYLNITGGVSTGVYYNTNGTSSGWTALASSGTTAATDFSVQFLFMGA